MIMRIPILKSILRNLDWFEEARRHHVAPDGSIFLGGTNHRLKKAGDWEESKHPRADNGQFGSGSGGSSKPKKPSKTRRKMERREEAASQARVGGAIQSLLSGGSALDKIGWLNTSKKPEATKEPGKNPPHVDMGGVPKNKSLITGSVSVSYDRKIRNRTARFFGGEDSPSGEHVHSEDAEYTTVSNVENFIYVQTHDGRGGWYPDIYNNTRRTNYYPGSKEDALTDIAAHPGGPTVDELYPTLADAIASDRSIPKDYKISPHSNKPPKPFDGAAVLEEYYRNHPEKRPLEAKPKEEAAPAKVPTPQTDIKVEDGEVAGSKILSLGNKRAGVMQHADGSFVVLSQVDRKTVDRKEFKSLDEANGFAEGWLKGGQEVPKQPEKPKAEETPNNPMAQSSHVDRDSKPNAEGNTPSDDIVQARWENSEFNSGGDVPTKDDPAEIDSYPYWYGDDEQTSEEAPAITYFHNGVQIYAPADPDLRGMNRIGDDAIERAINSVPPKLREYIEAIQINPYAEADMTARAQAEGSTIILFGDQDKYDAKETEEELPYIFNHEAAHLFDQGNKRISATEEYKDAIAADGNHVTSYSEGAMKLDGINGRNGKAEDFAEAVAIYHQDKEAFSKKHPNRAKVLDKIFQE